MTEKQQFVSELLDTAYRDSELLIQKDKMGDVFAIPRDVDFCLASKNEKQANTVSSFINDNRYGVSHVEEYEGEFRIIVIINMPVEQHIVSPISALMTCIAQLFSVEYLGWGSTIEKGS